MKKQIYFLVIFIMVFMLGLEAFGGDQPLWRVDNDGNLTVDGVGFHVKGGSWFGLNGRDEPDDGSVAYSATPMELYMGNVFWNPSGRTYDQDIMDFKALGFNVIRLPIVPQTLEPENPQGMMPYLKNHQSVRIENARLALETVIKKLDDAGLYVVLDMHSCSNFVGWRAGRLDARPPYPDKDLDKYFLLKEDCSCSRTDNPKGVTQIDAYDESKWLADLKTLAGLPFELGVSNIMGIDIFNEPWDYSWEEWRVMIDKAYEAINEVNPYILIFAQGVSSIAGAQDGTPDTTVDVRHGDEFSKPGYGENLYEAGDNPPRMPKNRLVYSPHVYGPSVYVHRMFMDPAQPDCSGFEGDEVGDNQCNIVINPQILEKGWEEHFGYLKKWGYAVVIGEFGGNMDWPDKATLRYRERYDYLTDKTLDLQWQHSFVDYLADNGIYDTIYWALNPESFNKGGVFVHAYDPVSNTNGWGTWLEPDSRVLDLLSVLWYPEPTLTPTPHPDLLGDVNNDNQVNIVDAMLLAKYYTTGGIDIDLKLADVDCSGSINIIDALLVAQYYVGIISEFC